MLIQRSDGESWVLWDAVERRLWRFGWGGVVAVLEVGAGFVHRGEAGAERCGGLCCLSGRFFLGGSLEEFLKPHVVLPRLWQQRWRVLLGEQAWLGDGAVGDSHEFFSPQVKTSF